MPNHSSEYWQNAATRVLSYYINLAHPPGSDYSDDADFIMGAIMNAVKIEIEESLKEKGLINE